MEALDSENNHFEQKYKQSIRSLIWTLLFFAFLLSWVIPNNFVSDCTKEKIYPSRWHALTMACVYVLITFSVNIPTHSTRLTMSFRRNSHAFLMIVSCLLFFVPYAFIPGNNSYYVPRSSHALLGFIYIFGALAYIFVKSGVSIYWFVLRSYVEPKKEFTATTTAQQDNVQLHEVDHKHREMDVEDSIDCERNKPMKSKSSVVLATTRNTAEGIEPTNNVFSTWKQYLLGDYHRLVGSILHATCGALCLIGICEKQSLFLGSMRWYDHVFSNMTFFCLIASIVFTQWNVNKTRSLSNSLLINRT